MGLIYYETENYEKAAVAFEQALKLEDYLAARHVAYAKVQEKLGNDKMMFQELEKAAELEPNRETYSLLFKAYTNHGMEAEADLVYESFVWFVLIGQDGFLLVSYLYLFSGIK